MGNVQASKKNLPPHTIAEVIVTAGEINKRVNRLVNEMQDHCRTDDLVMIGILRGSFMFVADLVRALYAHNIHPRIDFMTLESYEAGTESSGHVVIRKDITVDVSDADVVLIDDILDSGRTLAFAHKAIQGKGAKSVKSCVLLDKPERRVAEFSADFVGFTIENNFVVGYGLDYDSHYRELPYIARIGFPEEA